MSTAPPDPWIFHNTYAQLPVTIGNLAQEAGIKAGNAIYFGNLAKAPVDEMVRTMSYAAESAGNALRHITGMNSIPRLPSYWESTTIPDVLNTKGFHLSDTEFRVPFNYDQVSLLKSGMDVMIFHLITMVIYSDAVVLHLKETIKRMYSKGMSMDVDIFERILKHFDDVIPTAPLSRNVVPSTEAKGDIKTYFDMLVLKSAGLDYPSTIADCKAISISMEILGKPEAQFFGRITTTGNNDYFVAFENQTYYCRVGFEGEWLELKDTSESLPMPIELMSYPFVGCLTDPVLSHPRFLGSEADLLQKLVHHIHKETWVVPMKMEERIPTSCITPSIHCSEFSKLSAFCRLPPYKSLDRDPSDWWQIEYTGDPNMYINLNDNDQSLGKVVIRHIDWPGAHFIVSGYLMRSVNVYIGDGVKHNRRRILPLFPPLPIHSDAFVPYEEFDYQVVAEEPQS